MSADSLNDLVNQSPTTQSRAAVQVANSGFPETPAQKRRGCFFWGCLTSLFLSLIVTAAVGFLGYQFLTGQVRDYTADAAVELPQVLYSDADMANLEERLQQVAVDAPAVNVAPSEVTSDEPDAVESVTFDPNAAPGPGDLVLSARDINALIGRDPKLRGKVFITIEDGQIAGNVSLPMPNIPGGEGRFFNASAIFHVEMHDDQLFVTLQDAYVKGQQAPKILRDALAGENLAHEINKHPRMKPRLEKFESLSIVGDKVILRAKVNSMANDGHDDENAGIAEPATS